MWLRILGIYEPLGDYDRSHQMALAWTVDRSRFLLISVLASSFSLDLSQPLLPGFRIAGWHRLWPETAHEMVSRPHR